MDHGPENIRTNTVCPGAVDTPIIAAAFDLPGVKDAYAKAVPLRRVATAEDIAGVILFLASEDARHINGVNLPVDGGMTASAGQPDLVNLAIEAMLAMETPES
jgi:meso-butanediol dehydrogenase/(S,S)-butanediol dehydrogenase/diacetyl reductase